MLVRLYSGQIQGGLPTDNGVTTPGVLDRACRFVYDGTFKSMDGEVRITPALLARIAANHNARVMAHGGELPIGSCPPVQLDHTKSARDTVGRVVGLLAVSEQMIDGEMRAALLGTVRFLGAENVEKASDGRYSTVSIGADLATGELTELSVVPFPAATHATLLSRGEDTMDKEKLKKHLMKTAKCSAEEAEDKLAKMSDEEQAKLGAEADEDEKKLAAEKDEEEKKLAAAKLAEEEEEKKKLAAGGNLPHPEPDGDEGKRLSAAKPKLVQLMGQANDAIRLAKLEAKRAEVSVRLSKARASALLTPAEEKVLTGEITVGGKKVRLSECSDDAIALAFAVIEAREPVVHVGQIGTVKPVDLSKVGREVKLARVAEDTKIALSNMPFTAKMMAASQGKDGKTEPALRPADAASTAVVVEDEPVQSGEAIASQEKRLSALQDQITKLGEITTAIAQALA